MTQSRQTDSALRRAKEIRGQLIDLSYQLPNDPDPEVLSAWGEADNGLYRLIDALTPD